MNQLTTASSVSVVIPTHNRAELLRAAIESVLAQTAPVREVIVADDYSTDNTHEIVDNLASRGAPVIFVPAKDEGRRSSQGRSYNVRSAARNRGVAASSGSLIAFLDSDDIWEAQRIQKQLEIWEAQPEAGFAFCNLQLFDQNGVIGEPFLDPKLDYCGNILGKLLIEPLAVSSTLMVRRDALDAVGGWSEEAGLSEDYELTLRLAAHSVASYASSVLVLMRQHPNRTSQAHGEKTLTAFIETVNSFLATHPELPSKMRSQARKGIANVHLKLARYYLDAGDGRAARRHLNALIALRPWDRRAFPAYLRSFKF